MIVFTRQALLVLFVSASGRPPSAWKPPRGWLLYARIVFEWPLPARARYLASSAAWTTMRAESGYSAGPGTVPGGVEARGPKLRRC